jgi:hypothetical protein
MAKSGRQCWKRLRLWRSFGFGLHSSHSESPGSRNLDITARRLTPLHNGIVPNTYSQRWRLTEADLRRKRTHSVLDVGCGGAFFLTEMASLFGCLTNGIDLNALPPGCHSRRSKTYLWSMLYLKMLKNRNLLPVVSPSPDGQWITSIGSSPTCRQPVSCRCLAIAPRRRNLFRLMPHRIESSLCNIASGRRLFAVR